MSSFDDDPEYEAQLRDVLGSQTSTAPSVLHGQTEADDEELHQFVKETNDVSEDDVLDDTPTFRIKAPYSTGATKQAVRDDGRPASSGFGDDKALSEDARSVSTGDDSPSIPVLFTDSPF
jgi:hypothetical protein